MPAFDVLLLTSSFEGMPLAVLEAFIAGVPVVSTDVGVMRELLADGAGTVVANATPAELRTAIVDTLDRPRVDTAETQRARYGLQRMTADIQRVYDDVLGQAS